MNQTPGLYECRPVTIYAMQTWQKPYILSKRMHFSEIYGIETAASLNAQGLKYRNIVDSNAY